MITHDPEIAVYSQRIINIRDGKIINDKNNGRQQKLLTKSKIKKWN